jgi:hypothetical protein
LASSPLTAEAPPDWHAANHAYVVASLARLRCLVSGADAEALAGARVALEAAEAAMPRPPAITFVERAFRLSSFERDLLLLCAGVELDSALATACAEAQGDPRRSQPTFGLALAALPEAHWSAIGPASPLRRHCLIDIGAGDGLTRSTLRIHERVLHHLVGVDQPDERLWGIVLRAEPPAEVSGSHRVIAEQIVAVWGAAPRGGLPVIELCGPGRREKAAIAALACASVGLRLDVLAAGASRADLDDDRLARLLGREAILGGSALMLDCEDLDERADAPRWLAARRFAERFEGPVFVASRLRMRPVNRKAAAFEIERAGGGDPGTADMGDLAARVEALAGWGDLVLPELQRAALREIAVHVRQRGHLRDRWGFAGRGGRGLGVNALFAGASGTGKTLAAEVLARDLGLALYRVDLSQIFSKYIGDTEKNLRRVFDAAEERSAILLFDEADALFGPRSEVKDSHDRYANVEVAYLLQRMEAYRGLSILTTNLRDALDPAFLRRLRFVVDFPFPEAAEREAIWRRVFPEETPTEELDFVGLSRLHIAGGNIRNIALAAASLAAEEGGPVRMRHVWAAAKTEYGKLGRGMPEGGISAEPRSRRHER